MKSIFTKLSTLLLCGAVAMVSCTDFSEDIQNLDNKVNNLGNTTQTELASLQKAITDLEAKLSAQYATKDEVAALKTTLENSIASEVAALSEDIAEVSAALNTAKSEINAAIAGLDSKKADKADVDAAVETATKAIAALQAELEAAKGDLEAEIASVKAEIAAAEESLQEQINGVDAKANELQNTLLSLGEYLSTLEAKVNEINNTLLSLGEYLPTIEAKILEVKGTVESLGAEYEANKEVVDAKLNELFSTLVSLSNHLEEYEATTDFKLVELQGSLAALSTYLEEYEASVDAKFDEILNTFESLSLFLDEKFAALEATDTDLYKEIDGLREAFTTLNNLLADEVAAREAEDGAIYELIGSSVTALNNLIADLQAEDEILYAEIENVRTYVAQVYNALSTEIAAANAALEAHIAAFEAYKEVVDAKLAGLEAEDGAIYELIGTTATALNNLIADLQAEDEAIYAEINGVRESLSQAINYLLSEDEDLKAEFQEKVDEIYAEIEGVRTNIAQVYNSFMAEVAELTEQILANATAIAALEDAVEMLTDWALAHEGQYNDLVQLVTKHVADLTAQIEALQEEDGAIYELIGETATALNNLIADANARMDEIEGVIEQNYNTTGAAIGALSNLINDIQADLNDRVSANEEAIKKLFERVQSLVYVPEYADHKATIEYAVISLDEMENDRPSEVNAEDGKPLNYTYVANASELKYLVKADNAAEVAKAIEQNWAAVLDYEVKDVKNTRAAAQSGADLEIVNVKAEGEYIIVSVVAKNFDAKFFEKKKMGGIYSAALVLADENNTRTTEYTNLVPATPEFIKAIILDANGEDITFMECPDTEPVNLLPYDLDPEEVVVLKDHALSFVWNGKNYSASQLIEAGYDIQLDRRQVYTTTVGSINHEVDAKPQVLEIAAADVKFQIFEENFVSALEENNTHVTLTKALTKEQYLSLKPEEKTLDIDFVYNINGVEVYTSSTVEICNRLVVVDLGDVEIPWTMELAYNLHDGTKAYALPVKYTGYEYDLAKCANKPLEGYNLYSILQTGSPKKTHGGDYDIQMSISDKTLDFTLSGKYAFANVYDQDGWNDHTVQWVNEFEDLTITVKANIKLGQIPGTLVETDSDLEFKLVPGVNGWVYANSTIVEKMFAKYRDLIGFADDDEAAKAFFSERLAASKVLARELNGEMNTLLDPQNIDTPIHSFDPLKLGIHQSQIADAEKQTMFVQQWDKVTGANFAFEFDGTVVLPEYGLEYSTVDFVSYDANQERWEVEVDGDIVADASVAHGRKYTIDQADLGKYFYVNDNVEYGVETALTVQFEVLTKNAPLPLDTDVVGVFEDASSQINVLEEGKSVIKDWTNGGLFVGNEIEVKATLLANGFAIDTKDVTLYTVDPLTFSKTGDMVVERVPGKDAIAYTHSVLSLTSIAEEGNLINTESYPSQVFVDKYANEVYGAAFISQPAENPEWNCQLVRVYTLDGDEKVTYPGVKYMFNNGKVTLIADDGLLKQSIFAEVEYKLTHNYNYGQDETVTVIVEFKPNNAL